VHKQGLRFLLSATPILCNMKIVHLLLTHSFAGTERYVVELANAQALAGHDVTVILHQRAAEQRTNAIAHRFGAEVHKLYVSGPGLLAFWMARRALLRLKNVDVAHGHLSGGCRALHGLRSHFLRVATLHIHYKAQQHRDMDALIAIAPWQLAEVPFLQQAHTAQINNWTQAQSADPLARQRIRQELGLENKDFLIGALCRAEASKGLDVLIDAFVAAQPRDARLVIVGGGRDWKALRARARATIVMPGFVERPQDWFSAFDGYVSAARSEPFGLVFLEAFAAGLPVLATASQGAQMFQSFIDQPLLPCNDAIAMASALSTWVAKRPARRAYDLSAFECARQVAQIETFYMRELMALKPLLR
jgi:glycosyltransferase involved in cell wall biosynthesis